MKVVLLTELTIQNVTAQLVGMMMVPMLNVTNAHTIVLNVPLMDVPFVVETESINQNVDVDLVIMIVVFVIVLLVTISVKLVLHMNNVITVLLTENKSTHLAHVHKEPMKMELLNVQTVVLDV